MSMTDSLADMLTRIRNGQQARLYSVSTPYSKLRQNVLDVLKSEGYINGYKTEKNKEGHLEITIELKYIDGKPGITEIQRVSKPGRRMYSGIKKLKTFFNGLGVTILSTSKGVMSDYEARKQNLGGEVLCVVF